MAIHQGDFSIGGVNVPHILLYKSVMLHDFYAPERQNESHLAVPAIGFNAELALS